MNTPATITMVKLAIFIFVLIPNVFSQSSENWITFPKEKWPAIALTNNVLYKNGDRYIDPSFQYAGTGFLINTGKDTLAVTAKHVLWIARNKKSDRVQINSELDWWILKTKDSRSDSVVLDKLINEDSTEFLQGPSSTIMERDVLVFSVSKVPSTVYPLKIRSKEIMAGEKVYIIGNPYSETQTKIYEGVVVRKLGLDILIEQTPHDPISGISGSPIVDANGFLIAVFSSTSTDAITGKNVSIGISTEYLNNVLDQKKNMNDPKKDYGELIFQTVMKQGTKKAIQQYNLMTADPNNYYVYNLRSANRNGLRETGEKLIALKRYQEAIDILTFNAKINSAYFVHYNLLAKAWLLHGNKKEAIKNYTISVSRYNDRTENEAFEALEKLGVGE